MRRVTDEVSVRRGVYITDCKCKAELSVRIGDRLPECPVCKRPVAWLFLRMWKYAPPASGEPGPRP
jgi:hypothetical protein